MAYFPYNTPHSPMQVPDEFWDRYENKPLAQEGRLAELEDSVHTKAALAMTENLDWNVGRIVEKLEELNLMKNTIVIYFSDNGPNGHRWNDNMKGIKGNTDEGGIRSPFIIQWKGNLEKGTTVNNITSVLDIFPTLVELAGIQNEQARPFDGLSLKNLLTKIRDTSDQLRNPTIKSIGLYGIKDSFSAKQDTLLGSNGIDPKTVMETVLTSKAVRQANSRDLLRLAWQVVVAKFQQR